MKTSTVSKLVMAGALTLVAASPALASRGEEWLSRDQEMLMNLNQLPSSATGSVAKKADTGAYQEDVIGAKRFFRYGAESKSELR